mmetsp:Transcript_45322/g.73816  ORF Transcript_45322/g.73816 Transcript_45322/m.73816 type:complete len:205 (-) Transcript_45322:196-810(-)
MGAQLGLSFPLPNPRRTRDFGFVHFERRVDALKAIDSLHNTTLQDKTIECSLANPTDTPRKDRSSRDRDSRGSSSGLGSREGRRAEDPPPRASLRDYYPDPYDPYAYYAAYRTRSPPPYAYPPPSRRERDPYDHPYPLPSHRDPYDYADAARKREYDAPSYAPPRGSYPSSYYASSRRSRSGSPPPDPYPGRARAYEHARYRPY